MHEVIDSMKDDLRSFVVEGLKKYNIPGCSIGIVDKTGVVWSQGFGHTDKEQTRDVDPQTLFMIGSLSKAYTVTAYLRAVQKGLVALNDRLVDYYPEFSWKTRFGKEEREKITFRHLLTHWAGFQHNSHLYRHDGSAIPFSEYIAGISDTWQKYPVGARFSYSNIGFDLAAYTIERITGSTFENFVRDEVYKPLGMKYSAVNCTEVLSGENTARGYIDDERVADEMILIPQFGSGAQFSCVEDMARLLLMHFNEGVVGNDEFLSKELLEEMYTIPYQDKHQLMATGMGIGVVKFRYGGVLQLGFFGDGPGYIGLHQFFPELGVGWLVQANQVVNVFPFVGELIRKIGPPLIEHRMDLLPPDVDASDIIALPPETKLDASTLRRLEGKYISRMLDIDVVLSMDKLSFNFGGKDITLTPHSENEFSSQELPLVEFSRDKTGRPSTVKIIQSRGEVTILDNDSGPADATGPNKPEWQRYIGVYSSDFSNFRMYSTPEVRNGHLFLLSTMNSKEYCLTEWEVGVFFTADGQNVIFRDNKIMMPGSTWTRDDVTVEMIQDLAKNHPEDVRVHEVSLAEFAELLKRTGKEEEAKAIEKLQKNLYPS